VNKQLQFSILDYFQTLFPSGYSLLQERDLKGGKVLDRGHLLKEG